MAVSGVAPLQDIVTRLANVERQLDRMATARILSAPIGSADIGAAAILGSNIATGTITGANIQDGSVASVDLAANAVSTSISRSISTGPYFSSGGPDSLLFAGGSPAITTGATTQYMIMIAMVRAQINVNASNLTGYVGLNGSIYSELGTFTEVTANYFVTVGGVYVVSVYPSTAYTMSIWLLTSSGNLVTLNVGYGHMVELKR